MAKSGGAFPRRVPVLGDKRKFLISPVKRPTVSSFSLPVFRTVVVSSPRADFSAQSSYPCTFAFATCFVCGRLPILSPTARHPRCLPDARGALFMNKGFGVAKKKPARKKPARRSGFAYTGELRPGVQSPTRAVSRKYCFAVVFLLFFRVYRQTQESTFSGRGICPRIDAGLNRLGIRGRPLWIGRSSRDEPVGVVRLSGKDKPVWMVPVSLGHLCGIRVHVFRSLTLPMKVSLPEYRLNRPE